MTDQTQSSDGNNGGDIRLAEYVLGVLDADARREVEAEMAADPDKAERLAIWQEHLSGLADSIQPQQVPAALWARILARVEDASRAPHGQRVTRDMAQRPDASWWNSLPLWHWISSVSSVVAVVAIAVLIVRQPAPSPATPKTGSGTTRNALAATLRENNGTSAFTISVTPDHAHLVAIPTASWTTASKVPQLWLIAPGQKPRSLGVLARNKPTVVAIPAKLRKYANTKALVAVSVEPPGGSPTGQPTGPVIAKGGVSSI